MDVVERSDLNRFLKEIKQRSNEKIYFLRHVHK